MIRLRSQYRYFRELFTLLAKERKTPPVLRGPTARRFRSSGFLSESYTIYNFAENDPADYLPDYHRFVRTPHIMGDAAVFLDDKLHFDSISRHTLPAPRMLGIVTGGGVLPLNRRMVDAHNDPLALCRQLGSLVFKPVRGGGGHSIYILRAEEDGFTLNREPSEETILRGKIGAFSQYAVMEFVSQAEYARLIYPEATNTIRVLTCLDPRDGKPFVAVAVYRFGTRYSGTVDNWSQGGLSALIDQDSGIIGPGATYPFSGLMEWHHAHPDTGESVAGVVVPNWEEIKRTLLEFVGLYPAFRYVGWDVIPTDDGFVVLEGNANTDVNLLQVHGGFLADPRLRAFYKHHRVI